MSISRAQKKNNELPKALIAVHLYGQHADLDPLLAACEEYGVTLVEDAAESLGSTYKGRQTATTAPFSILRLNGNKIITTTGGGMCVSRDQAAAPVFRKWATRSKVTKVDTEHTQLGYNYRIATCLPASAGDNCAFSISAFTNASASLSDTRSICRHSRHVAATRGALGNAHSMAEHHPRASNRNAASPRRRGAGARGTR